MDNRLNEIYEKLTKYATDHNHNLNFDFFNHNTIKAYDGSKFITYVRISDVLIDDKINISPIISKINKINKPNNFVSIVMIPINYNEPELNNCIESLICQNNNKPRIILFTDYERFNSLLRYALDKGIDIVNTGMTEYIDVLKYGVNYVKNGYKTSILFTISRPDTIYSSNWTTESLVQNNYFNIFYFKYLYIKNNECNNIIVFNLLSIYPNINSFYSLSFKKEILNNINENIRYTNNWSLFEIVFPINYRNYIFQNSYHFINLNKNNSTAIHLTIDDSSDNIEYIEHFPFINEISLPDSNIAEFISNNREVIISNVTPILPINNNNGLQPMYIILQYGVKELQNVNGNKVFQFLTQNEIEPIIINNMDPITLKNEFKKFGSKFSTFNLFIDSYNYLRIIKSAKLNRQDYIFIITNFNSTNFNLNYETIVTNINSLANNWNVLYIVSNDNNNGNNNILKNVANIDILAIRNITFDLIISGIYFKCQTIDDVLQEVDKIGQSYIISNSIIQRVNPRNSMPNINIRLGNNTKIIIPSNVNNREFISDPLSIQLRNSNKLHLVKNNEPTFLQQPQQRRIDNDNNNIISILLPITDSNFNPCQLIESILSQTYIYWELIILNYTNSSINVDNSQVIIYNVIDIFSTQDAINKSLSIAKGKYWIYLDEHYILSPTAFEQLLFNIRNGSDISYYVTIDDIISGFNVLCDLLKIYDGITLCLWKIEKLKEILPPDNVFRNIHINEFVLRYYNMVCFDPNTIYYGNKLVRHSCFDVCCLIDNYKKLIKLIDKFKSNDMKIVYFSNHPAEIFTRGSYIINSFEGYDKYFVSKYGYMSNELEGINLICSDIFEMYLFLNLGCKYIVYFNDPNFYELIAYTFSPFIIFDFILPFTGTIDNMQIKMSKAIEISSIIIYPNHNLQENIVNNFKTENKPLYYISNGCEYYQIIDDNLCEINLGYKPVIGFHCDVKDWKKVDINLIKMIADLNYISVIIVGVDEKCTGLKHSNITYFNYQYFREIPKYISKFNICLLPFKNDSFLNPIQLYEYCATGKQIIYSGLKAIDKYLQRNMFYINQSNYQNVIDKLLKNELIDKFVQRYTRHYDWRNLTKILRNIICKNPTVTYLIITDTSYNRINKLSSFAFNFANQNPDSLVLYINNSQELIDNNLIVLKTKNIQKYIKSKFFIIYADDKYNNIVKSLNSYAILNNINDVPIGTDSNINHQSLLNKNVMTVGFIYEGEKNLDWEFIKCISEIYCEIYIIYFGETVICTKINKNNVIYIGNPHHEMLWDILKILDVGIIPYTGLEKDNEFINKVLMFAQFNIPIVSRYNYQNWEEYIDYMEIYNIDIITFLFNNINIPNYLNLLKSYSWNVVIDSIQKKLNF